MKKHTLSLIALLVMAILGIFMLNSCSGDDDESVPATEATKKQLTSTMWKVNKVTIDGVNKTEEFEGLTLEFKDNTFMATNGNVVWPANDTWAFTDEKAKSFERGDGVIVNINSVSATALTLSLAWDHDTVGGGRAASVSGKYVFEFVK